MNNAAERLAASLHAVAAAGGEADMLARFFRTAVDIVGTAVFGCGCKDDTVLLRTASENSCVMPSSTQACMRMPLL